jgi:hypothetical protein
LQHKPKNAGIWVEDNLTDPLTWSIGIALDLNDEGKKRFGELVREKSLPDVIRFSSGLC